MSLFGEGGYLSRKGRTGGEREGRGEVKEREGEEK